MGRDKAPLAIVEGELSQAGRALGLLRQFCAETYISLRDGQDVPLGAEGVLVLRDDPGAKMQVTFDRPQSSGFGAPQVRTRYRGRTRQSSVSRRWDALVGGYDRIRERIEAVIPGFADYNAKIRQPGGFQLRNAASHREWKTATGRANFIVNPLPDLSVAPGRLRLITLRSHNQYNTTISDSGDRYRGIEGERRVLFLNPVDMRELGLDEKSFVTIRSHAADGVVRRDSVRCSMTSRAAAPLLIIPKPMFLSASTSTR